MAAERPTISEFFDDRVILVTGGTGYMGKVLICKFLHSIPNIKKMHVLIRPKRGESPAQRLEELLRALPEPFQELRRERPEILSKVVAVAGDVTRPDLGLSDSDRKLVLDETSVVFHMAANVKFDVPLKTSIKENTGSTVNVVAFSKQMPRLISFIHVSTAFCQDGEAVVEERYYPPPVPAEKMLLVVDKVDDAALVALTPKILGVHENAYGFSKALSEDIVTKSGLPTGIARPSIVTGAWMEPTPGWVDKPQALTGLMVAAGRGVMRTLLCKANHMSAAIPCDNAVNATIALAWKVGLEKPKSPIFINVSATPGNFFTWKYFIETSRQYIFEYPYTAPMWCPGGDVTTSKVNHIICMIFLQIIPACLLDVLIYITGNEPVLVRVQRKVIQGYTLLNYYSMKNWTFLTDKLIQLENELCPTDRKTFYMDTVSLDLVPYIRQYIYGVRAYCLKNRPSTLKRDRVVVYTMLLIDRLVKLLIRFWIVRTIFFWIYSICF